MLSGSLTLDASGEVTDGLLDGTVRHGSWASGWPTDRAGGRRRPSRAARRPGAAPGAALPPLGPPLSTLIRLIENRQGAIDVALPVRGDLLSPEFGYRRVVWNLLPQVLWSSSPVSFVSSARSVLAAQRARSEAASASAGASPGVTPGVTPGTTAVAAGP